MNVIISIFIIVFAILQIILFFKLWRATNDIAKIKNEICKGNIPVQNATKANQNKFAIGDLVAATDNKNQTMLISRINNKGEYVCETASGEYVGVFSGDNLTKA